MMAVITTRQGSPAARQAAGKLLARASGLESEASYDTGDADRDRYPRSAIPSFWRPTRFWTFEVQLLLDPLARGRRTLATVQRQRSE